MGATRRGQTPVYVHSAPGAYLYCPVCPTGGMALTWFRDTFGAPRSSGRAREGGHAYDLLTALAAGAARLRRPEMLPHLAGAFSPEYVPEARGAFIGIHAPHTRGHFVRAVLEAVAFMLRRNVELLGQRRRRGAPRSARTAGAPAARSGTRSRPTSVGCRWSPSSGEDAAVRGDAMLAGVAAGVFPDLEEAGRAMVAPRGPFRARPLQSRRLR